VIISKYNLNVLMLATSFDHGASSFSKRTFDVPQMFLQCALATFGQLYHADVCDCEYRIDGSCTWLARNQVRNTALFS
jgi:hypothetical protein